MRHSAELPYVPFTVTAAIEPTRLCVAGGGVPFAADKTILTISTHQVLLRFTPADGCFEVLSAGRGHYYSLVPANRVLCGREDDELLVGSQKIDAKPARMQPLPDSDLLLLVNPSQRRTLGSYVLPTAYLHDSILDDVSGNLLTVDTNRGTVLVLRANCSRLNVEAAGEDAAPPALLLVREYAVATGLRVSAAHINSIALGAGCVWVLENKCAGLASKSGGAPSQPSQGLTVPFEAAVCRTRASSARWTPRAARSAARGGWRAPTATICTGTRARFST